MQEARGGPSFREESRDLITLTGHSGELECCSVCSGMSLGESEERNNWLFFLFFLKIILFTRKTCHKSSKGKQAERSEVDKGLELKTRGGLEER